MIVAYRYALNPTPRQERALRAHAGAVRVAFNWGLARIKANLDQREAERGYTIPDTQLTPSVRWSLYSLRKDWNQAKHDIAPWWDECSKEAYNTGLDNLVRALTNWADSRSGKRKGKPMGFPKFRSRHKSKQSIRFTTGTIRCDHTHATLPRLGRIRLHETPTGLMSAVDSGGRIRSATVRLDAGRWMVSYSVEQADTCRPTPRQPRSVVGVDLGIKTLAVLSTGEQVENPRNLKAAERKIRRLSRSLSRKVGPDRRTRRKPSSRWKRASSALAAVHAKVAHRRREHQHKLTTRLTAQHGVIVVEDLNVAGMVRNRRLAKAISDCGFAEIRRQLAYKAQWCGGTLVVVNRFYPSSKTCSNCGEVKAKLTLSERAYLCAACGATMDRDHNAALNIAAEGVRILAASGADRRNGRGADQRTRASGQVAEKRQPGTPQVGQTGTVVQQRTTADHELTSAH